MSTKHAVSTDNSVLWFVTFRVTFFVLLCASCAASLFAQCAANQPATPTEGCLPTSTNYEECGTATKDEENVLQQVLAGKSVKLTNCPVLRGCFVRDLLTRKVGIPQVGIVIDGAIIRGPLDIRNQEIQNRVELTHCTFEDDVNMRRSHLTRGISFAGSSFGSKSHGRIDAEFATIDFDFILDDCTFSNCYTFLDGIQVGRDLYLRRAWFDGKANFTGADVKGNLFADTDKDEARHTEFHDLADFEFLKVRMDCRLNNVTFAGFVGFGSADFSTLQITDSIFKGNVTFRSTTIERFLLTEAQNFRGLLTVEDMKFKYMSPQDWAKLSEIAERANNDTAESSKEYAKTNNRQFYASLENLFRMHGQSRQADEVYIAWRRKERKEYTFLGKLFDYPQDWFVGYGRRPERIATLLLIFIAIGNVVFRREAYMQTKKADDEKRYAGKYHGLLYSLDLLVPVFGLGPTEIWTPRDNWRSWYMYGQKVVGYILVTILLATLALQS